MAEVILCLHPAGGSGRSLQLDTHISFFSFEESFFLPKDWMTTKVRGMKKSYIPALKALSKELRHQIATGQSAQVETQAEMEQFIQAIRNKKNGGRGEAAGEERPPTVAPSTIDECHAITCRHAFRIITENGPHRSRFEQQD